MVPNQSPVPLIILFRRHKLSLHRYMYTLHWCAMCEDIGNTNIGLQERSNKDQYKTYKTYFPYLVIGLQKDAITGWLYMASYFFSMDCFNTCLSLICYVLQKKQWWGNLGYQITYKEHHKFGADVYEAGSIQRTQHFQIVDLRRFSRNFINRPLKLKLDILDNLVIVDSPLVYAYFLCFVSCFYLRDFSGYQPALRDLQIVCNGSPYDLYCLVLAYYTLLEYANALSIFVPFSRFLEAKYDSYGNHYDDLRYKLDLVIIEIIEILYFQ